ncbi:MAG: histidine kinase dimerization/phosphoacceptor domain -containing protein, partial [Syntrophales bacterium]|nr:histidine kinase dimerization/phosphoacceptor domain -containing protein [Syntrophales bacterium]
MRFSGMAPKKFSTRVIAITLLAGLIPVFIFILMIQIFVHRFPAETNRAISRGQTEQWNRNEVVIKQMVVDFIRQKAMDVSLQLDLYLKAHPGMTVKDLQRDPDFRGIAIQPVGRAGYTSVLDSNTSISRFHMDPNVENRDAHLMSVKLPGFHAIVKDSLGGRYAHGFYRWEESDGDISYKFMYIVPLSNKTADGVRFNVAASTRIDEFTGPMEASQDVSHSTAHYMEIAMNKLIRSFRNMGLYIAGAALLLVFGFAFWMGSYFSRAIVHLREATRAINQGDFDVRVEHHTSGDVSELVDDFNKMAETLSSTTVKKRSLEESEERLKKTNVRLQEEIADHKHAEAQIKQSLREKENLLAEIHHRVKNNMQIISSLLSLQAEYITDEKALSLVKDCEDRIRSMALVHEKLYLSEDLSQIDFSEYIESIATRLFQTHGVDSRVVTFSPQVNDILFTIETAIPLGLIINELFSNSLRYAFPGGQK